jgi:hypothetical protein
MKMALKASGDRLQASRSTASFDDPAAILVAAAGLQLEEFFGNLVEVVGQRAIRRM